MNIMDYTKHCKGKTIKTLTEEAIQAIENGNQKPEHIQVLKDLLYNYRSSIIIIKNLEKQLKN